MIQFVDDAQHPTKFYETVYFDKLRKPIFAQCWSMVAESDTLWRAYSKVIKDHKGKTICPYQEGVQVKSTPRKLIEALGNWCKSDPLDSCFLGRVTYFSEQEVRNYIATEIFQNKLEAFAGGLGHAESVLFKRSAFAYEAEVRLIYVDQISQHYIDFVRIPIDLNEIFDEVIFDPRLTEAEILERKEDSKRLGFSGRFERSPIYQGEVWQIPIARPS